MNVCSLPYLLLILIAAAAFQLLPNVRMRQLFFFALNFFFISTYVPNPVSWAATIGLILGSYLITKWLQRSNSTACLAAFIVLLSSLFLILKRYAFVTFLLPESILANSLGIVGLSYLYFRIIHVAVDATQQQIDDLTLWTYVNYNINLFGLLAGPIQRYQDFYESWKQLKPIDHAQHEVLRTLLRFFTGIIKVGLIAAACLDAYYPFVGRLKVAGKGLEFGANLDWTQSVVALIAVFYLYPLYIYFNFTGYCDIVIAAARLFGVVMPENFDTPFFARNLIEYWTRWHRTLGFWIRDYVFNPLYKALVSYSPRHALSWAYCCFFTSLFLTGVWHGSTWNFVVFGALNGLGVCIVKFWEQTILRNFGRPGLRKYLASAPIHAAAIFVNFHFVCLTMFFFSADLEFLYALIKPVFMSSAH